VRKFSAAKKNFPGGFLAKIIENPDFSEVNCYFVAILWPTILCMASQEWLGDAKLSTKCIQSLADSFLLFHKILTEVFCAKNEFLHYLKFSAFSMPQSDAYRWNRGAV